MPLSAKQLQRFISKTTYAGIICEKWTGNKPLIGKFEGLVSIETFNRANQGKVRINKIKPNEVTLTYGDDNLAKPVKKRRAKYNTRYPYKHLLLCPECKKMGVDKILKASTPGGKKSRYHCDRGHPYYEVTLKELHQKFEVFVDDLEFSKKYVSLFQEVFMRTYRKKRADTIKETSNINQHVSSIEVQQSNIADKILSLTSEVMIKKLEDKYEELELEKEKARHQRSEAELAEDTAREYLKYASHLIEHPKKLLIDQENLHRQEAMFALVFKNLPTYTEILNRTVDLHPLFKLKRDSVTTKSRMVNPLGSGWNTYSRAF